MPRKCKYCFTKSNDQKEICPVCKIAFNKTKKDLTIDERKIWHAARNLYIVSVFAILGGSIGVPVLIISLLSFPLVGLIVLPFAIFIITLGISLRKYRKWCYVGGIIFYSIVLLLNLVRINLIGIIFSGIFLYIIANLVSKKILYKEI